MSLTIDELKEKIAMVIRDIESLRKEGDSSRKIETLCEYKEYLEDQLKDLTASK